MFLMKSIGSFIRWQAVQLLPYSWKWTRLCIILRSRWFLRFRVADIDDSQWRHFPGQAYDLAHRFDQNHAFEPLRLVPQSQANRRDQDSPAAGRATCTQNTGPPGCSKDPGLRTPRWLPGHCGSRRWSRLANLGQLRIGDHPQTPRAWQFMAAGPPCGPVAAGRSFPARPAGRYILRDAAPVAGWFRWLGS